MSPKVARRRFMENYTLSMMNTNIMILYSQKKWKQALPALNYDGKLIQMILVWLNKEAPIHVLNDGWCKNAKIEKIEQMLLLTPLHLIIKIYFNEDQHRYEEEPCGGHERISPNVDADVYAIIIKGHREKERHESSQVWVCSLWSKDSPEPQIQLQIGWSFEHITLKNCSRSQSNTSRKVGSNQYQNPNRSYNKKKNHLPV